MAAVRSSETSTNLYQTTRRHTTDYSDLHSHRCKNLKFKILKSTLHSDQTTRGHIAEVSPLNSKADPGMHAGDRSNASKHPVRAAWFP
jgi:hypothetical protein